MPCFFAGLEVHGEALEVEFEPVQVEPFAAFAQLGKAMGAHFGHGEVESAGRPSADDRMDIGADDVVIDLWHGITGLADAPFGMLFPEAREDEAVFLFDVVHFVQARELDVAQTWKQRLDGGLSFDELLEDITGDSPSPEDNRIEFSWGKTEPQIEEVAYQMHVGDVSPVIPVSNGYIILELENRIQELLPTAAHSAARRSTAGKIIRRRKEAVRSGQFVEEFMRDKNVVLKGIPFSILISELEEWVEFDEENRNQPRIKFFIHREVNLVEDRLNEHLDDILVEFTGGGWTIRDFLEKLWLNEIPLSRETRRHFRRGLQESIRILVRDALLAKEGYRRGLDLRTSVKYDVGIWKDYFLSVLYSNQLKKENADIGERFRMLREKYGIIVNEEQLERIELTTIPMVAVWTDLQRQLVVPLWPLLEETSH